MRIRFNRLDLEYRKYQREYEEAALRVLSSGWYVLGDEGLAFEKEFADQAGAPYCLGLNSGLDALILAFRALEVGQGDEVIVPGNTYIASVLGITENGGIPVFVEPDDCHQMDITRIEAAVTPRTKAILTVHLYGQMGDIRAVRAIADRHGLYLVEDCAQSHGAGFIGIPSGTLADIGCFSFYPTKNLGAFGDAGAIVTGNKVLYEKIRLLRNYGSRYKYVNEIPGVNSRMDEIQAALLRVKLSHLDQITEERRRIADAYLKGISHEHIQLPRVRQGSEPVWHLFVIRTPHREALQRYLAEEGIETGVHYPTPPHLSKAYRQLGFHKGDFPVTEALAMEVLSLPLYNGMTMAETGYVIETLNRFNPGTRARPGGVQ
jgi:dTDP-4-amino-4,6-dideoxygalactose transaminase